MTSFITYLQDKEEFGRDEPVSRCRCFCGTDFRESRPEGKNCLASNGSHFSSTKENISRPLSLDINRFLILIWLKSRCSNFLLYFNIQHDIFERKLPTNVSLTLNQGCISKTITKSFSFFFFYLASFCQT